MTNSTDNSEVKKKKTKGPIRFEAIIPALIVFAMMAAYGHFFFDSHLRKAAEWTASYIHGAEVNIANAKSSVFGGFLEIKGIQVTDKKQPEQNMIAIGKIRFEILWDALLRAKFVVREAAVEQIEIQGPRKKKGWVRPPSNDPKDASAIEKIEQNALNQLQEENTQNILGDLAKVAGGVDEKDILKNLQGQLQAEKKIEELSKALKEKEAQWKKRLDELPNKKEFDGLSKKAKALKFNAKDPKQFAKDLKTLNTLIKEADGKVNAFKETGSGISSDVSGFNKEISSVDDLIKKDIADIEKRLNIPKLDGANFSKSLFMKMVSEKIAGMQKYAAIAREYMPPPKSERSSSEAEKLVPRQRGAGENVQFPRKKGYPVFWLQNATISSKASEKGFSGNIEGKLLDLTNNPKLIGKPTLLSFKGGFPNQDVTDIVGLVTIDHLTDTPVEKIDLRIGHFPVKNLKLSDSSDVQLSLDRAKGSSVIMGELQNQTLAMKMQSEFTETSFDMKAKSKVVNEILDGVLNDIPTVTLNANVTGSLKDLDININSNLGKELSAGFSRYLKAKTDAIKNKIRDQIRGRVDAEKSKLNSEFSKLKSGVDNKLKGKQKEIEQAKNAVKQSSQTKADASKKEMKDDLKKKGKELLKKLKF